MRAPAAGWGSRIAPPFCVVMDRAVPVCARWVCTHLGGLSRFGGRLGHGAGFFSLTDLVGLFGALGQQPGQRLSHANRVPVLHEPLDDRAAPRRDDRPPIAARLDVADLGAGAVGDTGVRDGAEGPAQRGDQQPPFRQVTRPGGADLRVILRAAVFVDAGLVDAGFNDGGQVRCERHACLRGVDEDAPVGSVASSLRAASRSSGVFRACRVTLGSARRARPVSVPAGGSSIRAVTPWSAIVAMQASQRTGVATCLTMRSSQSVPVVTTAPSVLDSRAIRGSCTVTVPAAARSAATAGAMCTVWKAPATGSGRSRAPAGGSSANAASCSSVPAATICPAPFTLAAVSPCASIDASTVASSPPSTAVSPVGWAAAASAIARPRTETSRSASAALSTPAMTPAASSPTLWPAAASPGPAAGRSSSGSAVSPKGAVSPKSAGATASAAATSSGWATAVSLISSAPAVVPNRTRSTPASSDQEPRRVATPGTSSQGERKPGAWAPWPGAVMTSTFTACTVEVRYSYDGRYEV